MYVCVCMFVCVCVNLAYVCLCVYVFVYLSACLSVGQLRCSLFFSTYRTVFDESWDLGDVLEVLGPMDCIKISWKSFE